MVRCYSSLSTLIHSSTPHLLKTEIRHFENRKALHTCENVFLIVSQNRWGSGSLPEKEGCLESVKHPSHIFLWNNYPLLWKQNQFWSPASLLPCTRICNFLTIYITLSVSSHLPSSPLMPHECEEAIVPDSLVRDMGWVNPDPKHAAHS